MPIHGHDNQAILDTITINPGSVNADAVCKGWLSFDATGTLTILDSFNVLSMVDNGVGNFSINWAVNFDNINYSVSGMSNSSSIVQGVPALSQVAINTITSAGALEDSAINSVQAFGDNANLTVSGSAPGVKVDSLCKGWVNFNGTGTIAIRDSFNVISLTDNGVGDYTVNWDVDFDNANYSVGSASNEVENFHSTPAIGSVRVFVRNSSSVAADTSQVSVQAFGDNPIALSTEADSSSLSKAWIRFNGSGTIATDKSFNVTSIVDNGTGNYTVNWNVDFADALYSATASSDLNDTVLSTFTAGALIVSTHNSGGTPVDALRVCVQTFGDQ